MVVEVELAAFAAAVSLLSTAPLVRRDDPEKKKKKDKSSRQGSPDLPMHLRPSLSPPPSPVTSPRSSPKPFAQLVKEEEDSGTLAFMAGRGFDGCEDDSMKPIMKIPEKKKQVKSHVTATIESDPMDCSTLVAMAGVNSFVENLEPISKKTVDRATSPTLPAHLSVPDALNANSNNNIAPSVAETVDREEEAKKAREQHRTQLLTQYHHVLREKKMKRTGSVGSIGSRHSLPSSLSLIPESQKVPASRGVTDKISNEFPLLTGSNSAPNNVIASGVITEEPVKRVSFQDLSPSPAASAMPVSVSAGEPLRLIGRPLPARPLPPIGGADANLFNDGNYPTVSPRSGNNRPLPPLTGMGMGNGNSVAYDTLSLHSAGSSTQVLYKTGSTNSLPTPDPRYVRGHLHKLLGGAKRKTPPPCTARPLPTSLSMGISNMGAGRLSPHQAQ